MRLSLIALPTCHVTYITALLFPKLTVKFGSGTKVKRLSAFSARRVAHALEPVGEHSLITEGLNGPR
jgi:hypothetical protein